jgi:hypothetical protein
MAETIPGGATKNAAGQWQNANGEPLDAAQVREAERLQAEQQEQEQRLEAQRQQQQLINNSAFAGAVQAIGLLGRQNEAPRPEAPAKREGR